MSMTVLEILSHLNSYTNKRGFTADLARFSICTLAQVSVVHI